MVLSVEHGGGTVMVWGHPSITNLQLHVKSNTSERKVEPSGNDSDDATVNEDKIRINSRKSLSMSGQSRACLSDGGVQSVAPLVCSPHSRVNAASDLLFVPGLCPAAVFAQPRVHKAVGGQWL